MQMASDLTLVVWVARYGDRSGVSPGRGVIWSASMLAEQRLGYHRDMDTRTIAIAALIIGIVVLVILVA